MKSIITHDDFLIWARKFSILTGLDNMHLPQPKELTFTKFLSNLNYCIGMSCIGYVVFGLTINMVLSVKNEETTYHLILYLGEAAPLWIIGVVTLGKSYIIRSMRHKIVEVFEELNKIWSDIDQNDEETVNTVNKTMKPTIRFCQVYILSWLITATLFISASICMMLYNLLMEGSTEYLLPYQIWFPFDPSKNLAIWAAVTIAYAHTGIFGGITISLNDSLFAWMVTCIVVQLKLLCQSLGTLPVENNSGVSIKCKLQMYIDMHNRLIRLGKLVERIYGPIILLNLLGGLLIICIQLFAITICEMYQIAKYSSLIVSIMTEIFIFTAFGHTIVEQSLAVSSAAYNSPWTDLGGPDALYVKKAIVLIVARSNRYMKISACGFTDMSLETFKWIIRTSFHYFALLRAVFQK